MLFKTGLKYYLFYETFKFFISDTDIAFIMSL